MGVVLRDANDGAVTNNTIRSNGDIGLNIFSKTYGNEVFHNRFFYNNIQINDYGSSTWNNENNEGNYWSDYSGFDNDLC